MGAGVTRWWRDPLDLARAELIARLAAIRQADVREVRVIVPRTDIVSRVRSLDALVDAGFVSVVVPMRCVEGAES